MTTGMDGEARSVAQALIDRIDVAWAREGHVPGDVVTNDAIYTNIAGAFFRGRAAIVEGTRQVKDALKTTVTARNLMEVKRLSESVIVALVASTAVSPGRDGGREFRGHQLYVIVWDSDAWRIAAYQNTRLPSDSAT
jgi:uncharacterized protein (TIGR02246 family)